MPTPWATHPYMELMREETEEALRNPDLVIRSTRPPETARIYHKWHDNTVMGSKWVKVVVEFLADGDAFVKTAYVERRVATGKEIWRQGKQ